MDRFQFVASTALMLFAAWRLSQLLPHPGGRLERALIVTAGVPLLVLPTLTLLGILGALVAPAALLTSLGWAATAEWLWRKHRPKDEAAQPPTHTLDTASALAAGMMGGVVVHWIGAHVLSGASFAWDDFLYHGPMIAQWIQAGRLGLGAYSYQAYYPGNAELFSVWFVLPSHDLSFSMLSGVYWYALGALAAAQLVSRLGATTAAWCVVTLYMVAGPLLANSIGTVSANELAGSALCLAALALTLSTPWADGGSLSRASFIGGVTGLAAGVKVTYAPVAALLLLFIAWRSPARDRVRITLLPLALCLLAGGYWYARNWLVTGNPLFPAALPLLDGPFDAAARAKTSLWFQWLYKLNSETRAAAWQELIDWPAPLAYLGLLGLAPLLRLPWRREHVAEHGLVWLVGIMSLAIVLWAPFSGTSNVPGAELQIRLRFFCLPAAIGLALGLRALESTATWSRWVPLAVTAGCLSLCPVPPTYWLIGAALGGLGLLAWRLAGARTLRSSLPRVSGSLVAPAFSLAAAITAQGTIEATRPLILQQWQAEQRGWLPVDALPDGARITWFSNFMIDRCDQYFRAFGDHLQHVYVPTRADGSRYAYLHEDWRQFQPTWNDTRPRQTDLSRLVENLRAQSVEYVAVMRRRDTPWPAQDKVLELDPNVELVVTDDLNAVYRLLDPAAREQARPKSKKKKKKKQPAAE